MDSLKEKISWSTQSRNISDLIPAEYNPRQLTEKQAQDLKASIDKFSLADPLVINADNKIIGGHQRYNILKASGDAVVDVRVPNRHLDLEEERELNIRLNKNQGEWDYDLLTNFDEDILKNIGFDSKELDKIFQIENRPEDDDIPDNVSPIVQRGEIYQLGNHRLMCGDSTDGGDVALLMDGKKSSIGFTSPPYNLGKSISLNGNVNLSKKGNAYQEYDDNKKDGQYLELLKNFTKVGIDYCEYLFINIQALAGNNKDIWSFAENFKDNFCDILIWDKGFSAPAMAKKTMSSTFEMIFVFKKENPSRAIGTKDFRGTISNIVRTPPQRHNEFSEIHGATFPVEFANHFIENFSNRNEIILDQFCGTGTTLIACEKSNRKCYGMEIDPHYCDVIIKRWEDFTGQKAQKV